MPKIKVNWRNYFFNSRLLVVLLLGFSSGLPLALTSSTLQAWYTVAGVNILVIGFLGLVGQPYIYKFLWAPLMDRYDIPFLGRRRGWMLISQIFLTISIILMSFFQPQVHPFFLGCLGLLVAFFSASQDITIDAYRTDLLLPEERGLGAAMAVAGYRIAMVISGGIALILAQLIGWHVTYILMGSLMVIGMVTTWFAPNPTYSVIVPETLFQAILDPIKDLTLRKYGIVVLLFIVLYKLNFELVTTMTPTFLLRDLGFTLIQIGTINKGVGFIALFLGIFIGGVTLIRLGVIRSLLIFGSLQALGSLGYAFLAITSHSLISLIAVICADNFFVGLESSAFVAFLMGLCNHRYTAMQFALLSALATIGRIFLGPIGALIVEYGNWVWFYIIAFVIAIPALVLLWKQQNNFETVVIGVNDCKIDTPSIEFNSVAVKNGETHGV